MRGEDHIAPGQQVHGADIRDLAPTILYAPGCPVPCDMDGRVLEQALEPGVLQRNPVVFGDPLVGAQAWPLLPVPAGWRRRGHPQGVGRARLPLAWLGGLCLLGRCLDPEALQVNERPFVLPLSDGLHSVVSSDPKR